MKIYHFCAPQFLSSIQREGLTLGTTPVLSLSGDGVVFLPNTQWLTVNPSFDQPWNGMVNVKYDRCAFRIRVSIPVSHRVKLLDWPQFKAIVGAHRFLPDFDNPEFSDCDSWRIYVGKIPASWLREVSEKPVSLLSV